MGLLADKHRFTLALVVVLSGMSVIPFTALPGRYFGWESYAGAYDLVFADGFEDGSAPWDSIEPPIRFEFEEALEASSYDQRIMIDTHVLRRVADRPVELIAGFDTALERVFSVEYRQIEDLLEVRLRALSDAGIWSEGDWISLDRPVQPLFVEWNRALPETGDGHLFLSEGDQLRAWLVNLRNHDHDLDRIGYLQVRLQSAVLPLAE